MPKHANGYTVTLSLTKKGKQNTLNTVQTKYHEIKALQDDTIWEMQSVLNCYPVIHKKPR